MKHSHKIKVRFKEPTPMDPRTIPPDDDDGSAGECDDPIFCDVCGDVCNEEDLYGSVHDEGKNFCRKQCVDDWEERVDDWEEGWVSE